MKHKILYVVAAYALLATYTSEAQNLDPTVEVRRDYEGKLLIDHKPIIEMEVPDSVYKFDLDFDYSVSDTPYKGAYEFVPYSVNMKPDPVKRQMSRFYLKAGAGYPLHPTLDLLWSPRFKKPFSLDIYGSNRSYIGEYWTMSVPDLSVKGDRKIDCDIVQPDWSGYDLASNAGLSGRYDWQSSMLVFGADLINMYQSNGGVEAGKRLFNSAAVNLGLKSKNPAVWEMDYAVEVDYRFTEDQVAYSGKEVVGQCSHDIDLKLDMESSLPGSHNMAFDVMFRMSDNTGAFDVEAGSLHLSPHYLIRANRWLLDIGVTLASVFTADDTRYIYSYEEQNLYPDCRVEFYMFPRFLKMYVDLGGGCEMNTYSSLVKNNRRLNSQYGRGVWNLLDVTDEKLKAELGFEGNVTSRFSYLLRGGYVVYGNAPLPVVYVPKSKDVYMPGLGYTAYKKAYAALDFTFDKKPLRFEGTLVFDGVTSIEESFEQRAGFIYPSTLKGDVSSTLNFNERIYISVDCEFSTERKGFAYVDRVTPFAIPVTIPGYADLGLEAEYRFNRKMSVWARGGNLLGMTIQRELLYAEKGPYFTAGICLNL